MQFARNFQKYLICGGNRTVKQVGMKFSHLHVHTQFSLLDGAASIQALYKKAIKHNMPALAITDHGNMFGAIEFVSEAYKHKNEDGSLKV